jgi:hypothetical protein
VKVGAPLDVQRRRIVTIVPHEKFNPVNLHNNIALFKLEVGYFEKFDRSEIL